MENLKRNLTREELHELVWSTPILKLAEKYGLSDRGLAKICAKHLVPTPPRGYWAKVDAGQPAKRTRLRAVANEGLHNIQINSSMARLSDSVRAALAVAKAEKVFANKLGKLKGPRTTTEITAPENPGDKPHTSIAAIVKLLRKAKPNNDGLVKAPGICVHERSRERAVTILHHFALTCEEKGTGLTVRDDQLRVALEGDLAGIALTEEKRRVKHEPTEEEQAEYDRRRSKRERDQKRRIWSFERLEPWPEFDTIYTGKLTIAYSGWNYGLRKSWSDGKIQKIETILGDFLAGILLIKTAEAQSARIRAETERRRQILIRQREIEKRSAEREEKRLEFLHRVASKRREILDLRATIDVVVVSNDLPPDYLRMIAWAEGRLAELEAETTAEQIQTALVEQNLYPDPDDLLDGGDDIQNNYRGD